MSKLDCEIYKFKYAISVPMIKYTISTEWLETNGHLLWIDYIVNYHDQTEFKLSFSSNELAVKFALSLDL